MTINIAETGSHEGIAEVLLSNIDGAKEPVKLPLAEFENGKAKAFEAGAFPSRDVCPAFLKEGRADTLLVSRQKEPCDALLDARRERHVLTIVWRPHKTKTALARITREDSATSSSGTARNPHQTSKAPPHVPSRGLQDERRK